MSHNKSNVKISFAPLQGFSDYIYRHNYAEKFPGIDDFYIPYIALQNDGTIKKSHLREIIPKNNAGIKAIPQVLAGNSKEFITLSKILEDYGYDEINLNLGCPYPMVAKKGRGSGLLPSPEKIEELLEESTPLLHSSISVKMRSGYSEPDEFYKVLEILNRYPLKKIIFHPRTGKQLYKGDADAPLFQEMINISKHPLSYNGDIFSKEDYEKILKMYPKMNDIMIGRGILSNPFLPSEIKGIEIDCNKSDLLYQFHNRIYESYLSILEGDGHVLNKMLAFWQYFSQSFDNPHKVFKLIKKAKSRSKYEDAVQVIFRSHLNEL